MHYGANAAPERTSRPIAAERILGDMRQVNFEHVFECDADTYWDKIFFDEEFNRKFFLEGIKFHHWHQRIVEQNDKIIKRVVEVQPPIGDMPGPVKKIIGDRLAYNETGVFDRQTRRYHFDIEPSTATDKTTIRGDLWLVGAGDKRVKRMAKVEVDVRIMMVGKIVEERIVSDLTASYSKAAEFTNAWVKQKGW